jgi:hypothetical protein
MTDANHHAGGIAECPYYRQGVCASFFDYLREHSCSLAERTVQYFCRDRYADCARFQMLQQHMPAEYLEQVAPWETSIKANGSRVA